jgi:mannitol/fructose-specific phosphotransferase system IIA component (Ntr-type)
MVLGFVLTNFVPDNRRLLASVEDLEPLIYLCFFTLAGTHLDLSLLPSLGLVGIGYILARFGGKLLGAGLGGWLTGAPPVVRRWLGFCLLPQAGVAVGLVVAIQDNPLFAPYEAAVTAVVLASIVLSELLGPVLVKSVLTRAGETGRAGHLLFGIVPREGITYKLHSRDKWELLRQLVDFAAETYRLPAEDQERLLQSVLERERSLSTGLGRGVAIPHGTVAHGRRIMGVVAVLGDGVDFDSLDGEPARVVILMVVPERRFEEHLQTLAAVSRIFSRPGVIDQVAAAADPHEFYHLVYTLEDRMGAELYS